MYILTFRLLVLLTLSLCCLSIQLFIMFSWLPYFTQKLFSFSCIWLLVCFHVISPNLLVEFSCCFGMFCFVCIVLPFVDIFLIFLLLPVLSGLFPQVVLSFLLLLFLFVPTCSSIFPVISFLPVFVAFLSAFPVEFPILVLIFYSCSLRKPQFSYKLILFLHRLVHLIWLFFVGIYVSTWFIFSVSILIVLHSMFLSDGKVVFCSFIILFKFSKFIFCFCVSVCSVLLGVVVFLFSEIGDSFWLVCSCLSVLGASDTILLSCSLYIF